MKHWLCKQLLKWSCYLFIFTICLTLPLKIINPPLWSWQVQRFFSPPANFPEKTQHQWVSLDKISKNMQLAVIAAEDQKFPTHPGIDMDSTQKAFSDLIEGQRMRGASTITQQTVKNLYLWSGKSFIRKGIEASLSLLVEVEWSKARILEIYLNIIEFGPGIYGVEAASQHFFHRHANQISQHQAAQLAAVLPNPYQFKVNAPTNYQNKRIQWIEKQMGQLTTRYLDKL